MSAANSAHSLMNRMETWQSSVQVLTKKHWCSGAADNSGSSFGSLPDHDPAAERITKHSVTGDSAIVETEIKLQSYPTFYEYRLKNENGNWRVETVMQFFDREEDQAFDDVKLKSLLARTGSASKLPPPELGDEPNCEVLFEDGKVVKGTLMQSAEAIMVSKVGRLSLPSGAIVARDFGYSPEDALPLSLKVKPGEYEVEVCSLEGRVAAIRVVFGASERKPFYYRQAVSVDGGSSHIGVDAGNVAICDALSFMKRSKRNHERESQAWIKKTTDRGDGSLDVTLLSLGDSVANTAVVSGSGYGDGCYPSYWVFDASDKLLAFVVDFQIAAEQLYRVVTIPWKSGASGMIFKDQGLAVEVQPSSGVTFKGERITEARWLTASGEVVPNSYHFASSHSDEQIYSVDFEMLNRSAATLEVKIHTGFRNNR